MKPKRRKGLEFVEKVAPALGPGRACGRFPGGPTLSWCSRCWLANLALYHGTVGLGFLSVKITDTTFRTILAHIENFHAANLKHILTSAVCRQLRAGQPPQLRAGCGAGGGQERLGGIHVSNPLWHGWVVCMVYLLAFTILPAPRRRRRRWGVVFSLAPGPRGSGRVDLHSQGPGRHRVRGVVDGRLPVVSAANPLGQRMVCG